MLFLSYSIYEVSKLTEQFQQLKEHLTSASNDTGKEPRTDRLVAWIEGRGERPLNTYLRHVVEMFRMMGYDVVSGSEPQNWDVLWTHEYSLMDDRYTNAIRNAKPHQFVNHIAGSGYYTSKVSLATSLSESKNALKAFQLPKEKEALLSFAKSNPNLMWVQKDNTHRNIIVRKLEEMNLEKENSFVQQFVDKPLLIDNRKFDIGVYTVVTSTSTSCLHLRWGRFDQVLCGELQSLRCE
ncbi:unnamed protein product [Cylicocyclus nassatus]|uniref:Uncharacterized protein n=1 Tax=Cylicocyclus nassatus TaxID=53992 RepID=A0AA36DLQ4_CYLNA|nr:unnamed protein product [Cylicocyclus nassatus]